MGNSGSSDAATHAVSVSKLDHTLLQNKLKGFNLDGNGKHEHLVNKAFRERWSNTRPTYVNHMATGSMKYVAAFLATDSNEFEDGTHKKVWFIENEEGTQFFIFVEAADHSYTKWEYTGKVEDGEATAKLCDSAPGRADNWVYGPAWKSDGRDAHAEQAAIDRQEHGDGTCTREQTYWYPRSRTRRNDTE